MTTQPINATLEQTSSAVRSAQRGGGNSLARALLTPAFWRENPELALAAITLIALLVGWIGGSLTDTLPGWAITVAALIAFVAGGITGTREALADALKWELNIDFLMVTAALGAAFIGEWEEGALLLFLFTLSGALEGFALDRTRKAIEGLIELRPETAWLRRGDELIETAVDDLQPGDVVVVKPGERLPVDGVVVRGTSTCDQSPITGESVPVYKEPGSDVFSATINGSGALDVQVTKLASESTLSKIIQLVQEAQEDAAPTQRLIDRYSQPYTLTVIGATLLAMLIPWLFGSEPFSETLYRAMTLLVVASPCALIISTPASILSAIAAAARGGVLFKGGAYLEKTAQIDVLAFDKTGTLTYGKPELTDIRPLNDYSVEDVVRIAAGAESLSEHPIARAILNRALKMGLEIEEPQEFRSIAGHGIQAIYQRGNQQEIIYIGNDRLFMSESMDLSPAIRMVGSSLQKQGKTAMLVVRRSTVEDTLGDDRDWEVVGYLAVADTLRENAAASIAALRKVGVRKMAMLTGDNHSVAEAIARQVGLADEDVYAELLPEQKVEIVRRLALEGRVAMVGDGVNDAPALATASVGIAMGAAGTDVALETADIVLMSDDLSRIPFAIGLSRKAERIVRQNLVFSLGVMLTLILLTIVAPLIVPGFRLPLPLGVVGHEGSTLIVVMNGLRMLAVRK
ncbi:MAG: cadmium-translocating P-type ATPase [Caldilineaceae bacterium]|nr:cadmium-translocating P-type ATPase [Caldilineaceae bacterium]HRJ42789.1 heavy metal translocating P-type ATPase [Caldilineaceae bacterium]